MVDITIRNLDEKLLREFKAEAVRQGKTYGEAFNEAMILWLKHKGVFRKIK